MTRQTLIARITEAEQPTTLLQDLGALELKSCPQCGAELEPGSRFCAGCGSALATSSDQPRGRAHSPPGVTAEGHEVSNSSQRLQLRSTSRRGALDLWGATRGRAFTVFALLLTAGFVWLEARYNIDLLNTLSDPSSTSEAADELSQRGKLLASFGITWAVARALVTKLRPAAVGLTLFVACATALYFGLDYGYARVIAGLSPEVKIEGFNLFSYRRDLLTGRLSDPDIPLPKDHPVEGKILMGSFPIVLLDDRFMLPARDIVERKASDAAKRVLAKAMENWPAYFREMHELDAGYREFINGSRKAIQYRAFGGIDRFRSQSGGLEPNAGLTRSQFVEMLRDSQHPKGLALRSAEAREVGKRPDGSTVYARDIPYFMDRTGYLRWFESQAEQAKAAALPTAATVEQFRGIQDINSAVFLPPMAIITSLTSAVTNLIALGLMLFSIGLSALPQQGAVKVGRFLGRFAGPLTVVIFAFVLALMPSHVFTPGTPMHELESTMHAKIGFAGVVWSKLSNVQAIVLR